MNQEYVVFVMFPVIGALLSVLGIMTVAIARNFLEEFKELRRSVDSLNKTMGRVVDRQDNHEHRIISLEGTHGNHA